MLVYQRVSLNNHSSNIPYENHWNTAQAYYPDFSGGPSAWLIYWS